jgi:hypothetical protein
MSLLTIGAVGVYRDLAPQAKRISAQTTVAADPAAPAHPAAATGGAAPASPGTAQDAGSVASFAQLLVAQIPSEALLAYTTLLAVFSAATTGYQSGRWTLYGLSLVACAASVIGTTSPNATTPSLIFLRTSPGSCATSFATSLCCRRLPPSLPWRSMA